MSVASHLAVSSAQYDVRIRSRIPLYDELIAEVALALGHAARPVRVVVDLGIRTGALARACLASASGARVWGIDADPDAAKAHSSTRVGGSDILNVRPHRCRQWMLKAMRRLPS